MDATDLDLKSYKFLKLCVVSAPNGSMPPSFMGAPVAGVVVPIVAAVSTLVGLRLDVHVHSVVVHCHPAHESFATVFAVEPFV